MKCHESQAEDTELSLLDLQKMSTRELIEHCKRCLERDQKYIEEMEKKYEMP